jgi:predicted permease
MWTYILLAISVTLITWAMMYIDSRLFDKPKARFTYVKGIFMVNAIVFAAISVLTWLSPDLEGVKKVMQIGGSAPKITNGPMELIADIGEEMIGGAAPF